MFSKLYLFETQSKLLKTIFQKKPCNLFLSSTDLNFHQKLNIKPTSFILVEEIILVSHHIGR